MKLCFTGFDNPLTIQPGQVSVLEVHNKRWFTRLCQSLYEKVPHDALEPFALWADDGEELNYARSTVLVPSPLELPWNDKSMVGELRTKMVALMMEDDAVRQSVEKLAHELSSQTLSLGFRVQGDYAFALEWDLAKYLSSFGFGPELNTDAALIDSLIKFLDFMADVAPGKVLVFINLKIFLSENEQKRFFERVFFQNLLVILVEEVSSSGSFGNELKLVVDQDFLETRHEAQSACPFPSQGEI